MIRVLRRTLAFLLIALLFTALYLMTTPDPKVAPGTIRDRLTDCPNKPNCVCSQAAAETHQIAPLALAAETDGWRIIHDVMRSYPRTVVVTETESYRHYECRTPILRFVDDVELLLDKSAGVIHIRSASRIGYSDLGANRKRVEEIRQRYRRALAATETQDRSQ